jgi:hypothetical protein
MVKPKDVFSPGKLFMPAGRRGCGKTTVGFCVIREIHCYFDYVAGVADTPTTREAMQTFFPGMFIFQKVSDEWINNILDFASQTVEDKKPRQVLIIMDDCMYDRRALAGEGAKRLFFNGRHYNITFVNCVQYVKDIGPSMRSSIDYVLTPRDSNLENRTHLFNCFFKGHFGVGGMADFNACFDAHTVDHGCMIYNTVDKPENILDSLSCYRPPDPTKVQKPFRVGCYAMYMLMYALVKPVGADRDQAPMLAAAQNHNRKKEIELRKQYAKQLGPEVAREIIDMGGDSHALGTLVNAHPSEVGKTVDDIKRYIADKKQSQVARRRTTKTPATTAKPRASRAKAAGARVGAKHDPTPLLFAFN